MQTIKKIIQQIAAWWRLALLKRKGRKNKNYFQDADQKLTKHLAQRNLADAQLKIQIQNYLKFSVTKGIVRLKRIPIR